MKILILCLSAEFPPYDKMIDTAQSTWDSVDCEGMETVFYCGESNKPNTDKIIYLPVKEDLYNIGHKTVGAFEWALANKEFDFVARVHSSIYVDKIKLKEYILNLTKENLFMGVEVKDVQNWVWGGLGYIISKDVIKKIVDNKDKWNHAIMEDVAMSLLVSSLGIPFTTMYAAGIDKVETGWQCVSYNGESITFSDFNELKRLGHHYFRVKQDGVRKLDEHLMTELFKALKP